MEKNAFTVTTSNDYLYQVIYQITPDGYATAYVYPTYALYEGEQFISFVYAEDTDTSIDNIDVTISHSFAVRLYGINDVNVITTVELPHTTYELYYLELIANEITPMIKNHIINSK